MPDVLWLMLIISIAVAVFALGRAALLGRAIEHHCPGYHVMMARRKQDQKKDRRS